MRLINLSSLTIPEDRIRKAVDPDKMHELRKSIETLGLLHLPVVRVSQEAPFYTLVAGFRRTMTMQTLHEQKIPFKYEGEFVPAGKIPFCALEDLSAEAALEIELQENIMRQDISWQERAVATAKLHEMRLTTNPEQTTKATAEEVGAANFTTVGNRLILAKHLNNPEIASAPSEAEAMKRLQKGMIRDFNESIGKQAGNLPSNIILKQGDALELLAAMKPGTVQVILTDPPYGINAHKFSVGSRDEFGEWIKGDTHKYDDSPENFARLMTAFAKQSFRVAATQAHLYAFCDITRFNQLAKWMEAEGWVVWRKPYIWHRNTGQPPDAAHGPRPTYECILYARKGNKQVNRMISDVIICDQETDKVHPAQKPIALLDLLLDVSAMVGDTVLDPFCGSGSTLVAAKARNLSAIGFELDPVNVGIAKIRLET